MKCRRTLDMGDDDPGLRWHWHHGLCSEEQDGLTVTGLTAGNNYQLSFMIANEGAEARVSLFALRPALGRAAGSDIDMRANHNRA